MSENNNNNKIFFRVYIRKHRRINIPKEFPDIKDGDLYNVTLEKVDNNNSEN